MLLKCKDYLLILLGFTLVFSLISCDITVSDDDNSTPSDNEKAENNENTTEIKILKWDSSAYDADIDNTAYEKLKGTWKLVSRTSTVLDVTETPAQLNLMVFREDKCCAFYFGDDMSMDGICGLKELTDTEIIRFWNIFPRVETNCSTDTYELSNSNTTLTISNDYYSTVYEKSDLSPVSAFIVGNDEDDYYIHWVDVENNISYLSYRNQADITARTIRCWASEGAMVTVEGSSSTLDLSSDITVTVSMDDASSEVTVKTVVLDPNTENMIPNGDFSMGMVFFRFGDDNCGAIGNSWGVEDGVFKATKKSSLNENWSSQLHIPNASPITLEKGKYYQLSVDAWASGATSIYCKLSEYGRDLNDNDQIWDEYSSFHLYLTQEKKTYTKIFLQDIDDDLTEFAIQMGNSDKTIYIDNIVLKEINNPNTNNISNDYFTVSDDVDGGVKLTANSTWVESIESATGISYYMDGYEIAYVSVDNENGLSATCKLVDKNVAAVFYATVNSSNGNFNSNEIIFTPSSGLGAVKLVSDVEIIYDKDNAKIYLNFPTTPYVTIDPSSSVSDYNLALTDENWVRIGSRALRNDNYATNLVKEWDLKDTSITSDRYDWGDGYSYIWDTYNYSCLWDYLQSSDFVSSKIIITFGFWNGLDQQGITLARIENIDL